MIKKMIFTIALLGVLFTSCNSGEYDTRAINSLDKLSETIGELKACSYTLNTIKSTRYKEQVNLNDVYMRGPDRLYIHTAGMDFRMGWWYNGKNIAYFSYNNDEYDIMEAPGNILDVIDFMHEKYNIDFPASDFFYPSLTDDIIENYNSVLFVGEEEIEGVAYVAIEASNAKETLQIWIEKSTNLPHRLVVESKTDEDEFYDAVFSNWKVNPNLPDVLFEFQPLENISQVHLNSKN